jgi:hypothetical protein
MELGHVRSAGLACEIIDDRAALPDEVACMVRVLILSDGLKAADARRPEPRLQLPDAAAAGPGQLRDVYVIDAVLRPVSSGETASTKRRRPSSRSEGVLPSTLSRSGAARAISAATASAGRSSAGPWPTVPSSRRHILPTHGGMTVWLSGPVTSAVTRGGSIQHVARSNMT